jgi:hypothetical protein
MVTMVELSALWVFPIVSFADGLDGAPRALNYARAETAAD